MLKLAGETILGLEKIEAIAYSPEIQNSGDLEAATKTITATSEASGTENADYNAALTLAKPDDARLVIQRIAARLAVTIDSMTASNLYLRVYVDQQDADHRLFDENWTSSGAKLDAVDSHSGALATIFALLADGSSHTFYYFFWVDSGNAVISLVQLWEGVGHIGSSAEVNIFTLSHQGLAQMGLQSGIEGTGTHYVGVCNGLTHSYANRLIWQATGTVHKMSDALCITNEGLCLTLFGTVATDLLYLRKLQCILRSEQ